MNFVLTKKDGKNVWAELVLNQETDKIERKPIEGSITLDPNEYYEGDEITINTNPLRIQRIAYH